MSRSAVLAMAGVVSTACTTLEVTPLPATGLASGTFVYVLPKTVLIATGTATLTGCRAIDTTGNGTYEPALDLAEVVAVTPSYEADPTAQYQIPYDKLRSWSKEIQVTVTANPNKSLQGINGTVNDQAGPVALAGVLAAVKIAGGFGILPVLAAPPIAGPPVKFDDRDTDEKKKPSTAPAKLPPPPSYCSKTVLDALAAIDKDTTQIRADAKQDATDKNTVPNQEIAQLQSDIARQQVEGGLVRKFTLVWSPEKTTAPAEVDGIRPYSQRLDLYTTYVKGWLSDTGKGWFAANATTPKAHAVMDPVVMELAVKAWTVGPPVLPTDSKDMILRDPALGTLRVCRNACAKPDAVTLLADTTSDLAAPTVIAFGQFGRVVQLPLKNSLFENSSMVIAMGADGSITSLANHSTGTLATGLGTAGSIGDAIGTAQTQRNASITAANTAATGNASFVDAANKALADCFTQQTAVRNAGGTPIGSCQ